MHLDSKASLMIYVDAMDPHTDTYRLTCIKADTHMQRTHNAHALSLPACVTSWRKRNEHLSTRIAQGPIETYSQRRKAHTHTQTKWRKERHGRLEERQISHDISREVCAQMDSAVDFSGMQRWYK